MARPARPAVATGTAAGEALDVLLEEDMRGGVDCACAGWWLNMGLDKRVACHVR